MLSDMDRLVLNDIQTSTAMAVGTLILERGTDVTLWGHQSPSDIVASRSFSGGALQIGLPRNQWQIEMENLQANINSVLQSKLRLRVTGPREVPARKYIRHPATDAERQVCGARRVRTGQGFSNVSFLGLLIVLCLGFLIILASLVLDTIAVRLGKDSKGTRGRHNKSWVHDHVLQIQRVAYEGQSWHQWHKINGEVPVTASCDVTLGLLRRGTLVTLKADISTDPTQFNRDDKWVVTESPVAETGRTYGSLKSPSGAEEGEKNFSSAGERRKPPRSKRPISV
jgi:hypothetical protein